MSWGHQEVEVEAVRMVSHSLSATSRENPNSVPKRTVMGLEGGGQVFVCVCVVVVVWVMGAGWRSPSTLLLIAKGSAFFKNASKLVGLRLGVCGRKEGLSMCFLRKESKSVEGPGWGWGEGEDRQYESVQRAMPVPAAATAAMASVL